MMTENYNYVSARKTQAQADKIQAEAMAKYLDELGDQPAEKTNPLIFILPGIGILAITILLIAMRKKRK